MTDKTPAQLIQEASDRAVDQMALEEVGALGCMGPGQRDAARQTVQIFERVRGRHGTTVALSVVLRLAVLQVCRDAGLLAQFRAMAARDDVGVIRPDSQVP